MENGMEESSGMAPSIGNFDENRQFDVVALNTVGFRQ